MNIVYEDVDPFKFLEEMKAIFPAHYEELCVTKDFPLDPDYDAYKRMSESGQLKAVICRAEAEVIGYIVFIIQPHLHYKTCLTAFEDLYYVKKEYRKGRVGLKLFQYAEKALRNIGVNRIIMHTKVIQDHSRLFEYLGYTNTDKLFTKLL